MNVSFGTSYGFSGAYATPGTAAPRESSRVPAGPDGSAPPEDPASSARQSSAEGQDTSTAKAAQNTANTESQLTQEDLQLLFELKQTDTKVRSHEMAHIAAGGSLITSSAQFSYKTGPDGKQYAVAGEVGIDTSSVSGDPQATIKKMNQVKQAAMAPADPSGQDLKVAAQAAAAAARAMGEMTQMMADEQEARNEATVSGSARQASQSYSTVDTLPETDTHTLQLAV